MTSVYELKPHFQNLLRPLCRTLANRGIRPNQVTWAALVLSAGTGMGLALWPECRRVLLWVPAALFLRMALNAIDGMLAREHDMRSRAGALLNEVGDVVADAFLFLPFALVRGVPAPTVVLVVVLAGITEVTGLAAAGIGAPRGYQGPMGKSDRAVVFGALAFLLGVGVPAGRWVEILLILVNLLLGITVFNRFRFALKEPAP